MPTSGIRIVKETNLSFPQTLLPVTKQEQHCNSFEQMQQPTDQFGNLNNILIVDSNNSMQQQPATTIAAVSPVSGKTFVNLDAKTWQGGISTIVTPAAAVNNTITPAFAEIQPAVAAPARRGGGRRSVIKEEELSPDESARLALRRERNKQAAARCRKRRLDQTESLQKQVNEHEERKRQLQEEIHTLQTQKEDLEFILSEHRKVCARADLLPAPASMPRPTANNINSAPPQRMAPQHPHQHQPTVLSVPKPAPPASNHHHHKVVEVKSEAEVDTSMEYQVIHLSHEEAMDMSMPEEVPVSARPARPLSLSIKPQCLRSIEGIPIETPTNVFSSLNFDALMDGRTGLTPTNVLTPVSVALSLQTPVLNTPNHNNNTTTCASQQQRSNNQLRELAGSPDNVKLVSL